ncbi:MAG: phosphocholine cytidylyltransferase family protein [Deltaproteobacteria bacterium]|nr:phosphocholine cytidylyltransferase family protein [Deltaproteobacteria bacterium]MBI3388007.1 phosphocholine cytidylyltransferase family protein [Deltaproteobacteria bacterium]
MLTRSAIILAAGLGARLRSIHADQPKGFIEIGGQSLIERSVRLLRRCGVDRIVIVAGFQAEAYHRFAAGRGIQVVENSAYATTGTMASLALALDSIDGDFLLLESDLFYEPRALDALLAHPAPDVILASGFTQATDEVWVDAVDGTLHGVSKIRSELNSVIGEFVCIARISQPLAALMRNAFETFVATHEHGRLEYDTTLVPLLHHRPVKVCLVPDLLWGEIDDEFQYRRVRDHVWPATLAAKR